MYNTENHTSLVAQMVKNLPAVQETQVQSLRRLEKEMQPTPVFLHGKFHGQRSLEGNIDWLGLWN